MISSLRTLRPWPSPWIITSLQVSRLIWPKLKVTSACSANKCIQELYRFYSWCRYKYGGRLGRRPSDNNVHVRGDP